MEGGLGPRSISMDTDLDLDSPWNPCVVSRTNFNLEKGFDSRSRSKIKWGLR